MQVEPVTLNGRFVRLEPLAAGHAEALAEALLTEVSDEAPAEILAEVRWPGFLPDPACFACFSSILLVLLGFAWF